MREFTNYKNGRYLNNTKYYKEIKKLYHLLRKEEGKAVHLKRFMDGYQITVDGYAFDVIEHFGSYGNEQDRLEIMGLYTYEECGGESVLGI